jgi:hypothetical protein
MVQDLTKDKIFTALGGVVEIVFGEQKENKLKNHI